MIRIYTDGSTSKNGQKGAKGGIGIYFTKDNKELYKMSEHYTYNDDVTNNTCELFAILRVLEVLIDNEYHRLYDNIELYSDSKYCIQSLTIWVNKWKRNNWVSSSGISVKNMQLIKDIDELMIEVLELCDLQLIHTRNFNHRIPPPNCEDYIWVGNFTADQLANNGRLNEK
jgi:ribonuclease HI